jgi:flagellar hook protein FlgE
VTTSIYRAESRRPELSAPGAPNANGLGAVQSGYLEMSNVDLASQLTSLITTQQRL